MTLAQNHRPPLSGSKSYWLYILIILFLAACSPKTTKVVQKPADKPAVTKEERKEGPVKKSFTEASISLLIPFNVNYQRLKTADKAEIERSAMAIDFYQGFKLGIDSASAGGLNFKLNVYDTKADNAKLEALMRNGSLLKTDLVIGPVFPDGLKHLAQYSITHNIPVVSPLAASHPAEFNNPNLISVANNIDLHVQKMGDYIQKKYNPASTIIVLINPKKSNDEVAAAPVRRYFTQAKKRFVFQEYSSVYTMETNLIKGKQYVVIVTSSDHSFVMPTISKLVKMKKAGLGVDLFGHPDWTKQTYNVENLQALNTMITSAYRIDYKRQDVINFVKTYRQLYNFEPGEFSFKGFDIGYYFGTLFSKHGSDFLQYLTKDRYEGLHNSFSFYYQEKLGYVNNELMLLRYSDYTLQVIQ